MAVVCALAAHGSEEQLPEGTATAGPDDEQVGVLGLLAERLGGVSFDDQGFDPHVGVLCCHGGDRLGKRVRAAWTSLPSSIGT